MRGVYEPEYEFEFKMFTHISTTINNIDLPKK